MLVTLLVLFISLLVITLLVVLQIWLCKKSIRLGLILPCISLVMSLLLTIGMILNNALLSGGSDTLILQDTVTGEVIQEDHIENDVEVSITLLSSCGIMFLVSNIPTVVFGCIWLHYKGRRDTLSDLKRIQIEDLE